MASRLPIVVGILAIAGGITWFALRRGSDAPGTTQGSGPLTTGSGAGSGKAAISAPERPALTGSGSAVANAFDMPGPALPDGGVAPPEKPSHRNVFAAQARDNDWADATEEDLKDRVRTLKLTTVSNIDCRTDQCELTLSGSADTVDATIAKLESGLSTTARSLLLGRPERSDNTLTLRAYAIYQR